MATIAANNEFDIRLIELVQANVELYTSDLRASPYESMKKKIELWNSIASSMNAEAGYCIARWKSLRDRFRRELQKVKQTGGKSRGDTSWNLFNHLLFLQDHIKCYSPGKQSRSIQIQQHSVTWSGMDAENLIEEVLDDDPLQEPMEEQFNFERDRCDVVTSATSTTYGHPVGTMRRIESLLEGLDDTNRSKAERRIVAYLCKCNLRSLNNEDVDDVTI